MGTGVPLRSARRKASSEGTRPLRWNCRSTKGRPSASRRDERSMSWKCRWGPPGAARVPERPEDRANVDVLAGLDLHASGA
jgi:hypothetical protein